MGHMEQNSKQVLWKENISFQLFSDRNMVFFLEALAETGTAVLLGVVSNTNYNYI